MSGTQKIFNQSPRSNFNSQLKIYSQNDEGSVFVYDLQQKLLSLEEKYSNFVEKCTNLLKSSHSQPSQNHFFLDSVSFKDLSLNKKNPKTFEFTDFAVNAEFLQNIENGTTLRETMEKVSDIVTRTQEKILRLVKNIEKVKIKESLNTMTGDIWDVLFENETNLKEFLINFWGTLPRNEDHIDDLFNVNKKKENFAKTKQKVQFYKMKYQSAIESNEILTKKLNDQYEYLKKIKRDHSELKKKMMTPDQSSIIRGNSASRLHKEKDQSLFGTRSLNTSPSPSNPEEKILKLQAKNEELQQKLEFLQHENEYFHQNFRETTSYSGYELEKKEIQDQLRALQVKLQGFEKIAKNLIDNSIRTELSLLDKKDIKKNRTSSKHMVVDSPELSLLNSHCSLLDVDQLQKNVENLEKEKNSLEVALFNEKSESEKKSKQYLEKISELEVEIQRLSEKIEEMNIERKKNQEELENQWKINENTKKSMEKLESEVKAWNERSEGLKLEKNKVEKENNERKLRIEEIEKEIEKARQANTLLKEKNKEFKHMLKESREEKTKILNLNAKHSKNTSSLECVIEDLNSKYSQLLIESEKLRLNDKENTEKIAYLTKQIEELEEFNKDLEENYEKIKKNSGNNENYVKNMEKLKTVINELEENNEKKQNQLKENEKLIEEYKKNIENIQRNLDAEYSESKIVKKELEEVKNELKKQIISSEKVIKSKNEIIKSFELNNSENLGLLNEIQELQKLKIQLEQKINSKNQENFEYSQQILNLKKELDDVRKENNENIVTIKILNESKLKLIGEKSEKMKEISVLSASIEELNERNGHFEEDLNQKNEKIESLNEELKKIKKNITKLEIDLKSTLSINQDLENDLSCLNESYKNLIGEKSSLEKEIKKLSKFNQESEKNIEKLSQNLSERTNEIEKLESQLNTLKAKDLEHERLKKNLENMKNMLESKDSLINSYENIAKDASDTEVKLKNSLEIINSLNKRIQELEYLNKNLTKEVEILKKTEMINAQENQKNSESLNEIISSKNKQIKIFEEKIKEIPLIEGKIKDLIAKLKDLEQKLEQKNETIQTLEKEIILSSNDLSKKIKDLQENIEKDTKSINELKVKLLESEKKNFNFQENEKKINQMQIESNNALIKSQGLVKIYKEKIENHSKTTKFITENLKKVLITMKSELKNQNNFGTEILNACSNLQSIQNIISKYQGVINLQEKKIKNFTSDILINQLKLTEVVQESEEKNVKIEDVLKENAKLKEMITSLEKTNFLLRNIESKFEDFKKTVAEDLQSKNLKISELLEEIHNSEKDVNIEEKKNQIIMLTEKIERLEAKLTDYDELRLKDNLSKIEMQKLDGIINDLNKKFDEKSKLLNELREKEAILHLEHEKLEFKHKEVLSENSQVTKEKNFLLSEKESLLSDKKNLLEKNSILTSELEKSENKYIKEVNTTKILEKTIESKSKSEENLQSILLSKQKELEFLQQELQKLREDSKVVTSNKIKILPLHDEVQKNEIEEKHEPKSPGFLNPLLKSRGSSIGAEIISRTGSIYNEGFNIVPSKLLKAVTVEGKRWNLYKTDQNFQYWKEDLSPQNSASENFENEEDLEEIKIALGQWYTGSIIQGIEKLKEHMEKIHDFSFKEDIENEIINKGNFDTFSFRGEIIDGGLEISRIEPVPNESENFEKLKAENLRKEKKIEKKKRTLLLHREQIVVLKEQLRKNGEEINRYRLEIKELEEKLQNALGINLIYLKMVFGNLVVMIKADKNTEDLIGIIFKVLNYTQDEIEKIQIQRKGDKKLIKSIKNK